VLKKRSRKMTYNERFLTEAYVLMVKI